MAVSQYLRSMLTRRSWRLNSRTILRLSLALRDQISNLYQRISVIFGVGLYLDTATHPKRSVTLLVGIPIADLLRNVCRIVFACPVFT